MKRLLFNIRVRALLWYLRRKQRNIRLVCLGNDPNRITLVKMVGDVKMVLCTRDNGMSAFLISEEQYKFEGGATRYMWYNNLYVATCALKNFRLRESLDWLERHRIGKKVREKNKELKSY